MTITVFELTQMPQLQLTLVAGERGACREVAWAHTSDLPNPCEWLGTGELLLTNGMGLGSSATAQVAYLDRLSEIAASGLVIGLGTARCTLTRRLVRRADELEFPLLTAPYSLRFTAVVRAVAHANDLEESSQLAKVARLYDLLRASLGNAQAGPELFRTLGRELGVTLTLVDPESGLTVVDGQEESSFGPALAAAYQAHGRGIPGLLRLSSRTVPTTAVAVAVPGVRPTALVVESSSAELPSSVMLEHLAIGAGLELAQLVATQARRRRLGAELLSQLLSGRFDAQLGAWQLEEAGIVLSSCVLAAVRPSGELTEDLIHGRLQRARVPHLLVVRESLCFVLLPETAAVDSLLPLALAVGLSGELFSADRVAEAGREAGWALGVAEAEGRDVAHYGDATALLLPRTPVEAGAIVQRVLGPLLTYDAEHGTEYTETLRALLERDRSWQAAAADLHVHRQTLAYRLRKIEELTGRGTTRTEDLAEWWFALRALALLGDQRGTPRRGMTAAGPPSGHPGQALGERTLPDLRHEESVR